MLADPLEKGGGEGQDKGNHGVGGARLLEVGRGVIKEREEPSQGTNRVSTCREADRATPRGEWNRTRFCGKMEGGKAGKELSTQTIGRK